MTKVIGIGLQRTGTTSLYHALNELGIKSAPDSIPLFYNRDFSFLGKYDAFMDNPIPLLYQQIDEHIDDCKFILTTRTKSSWLKSVEWLFNKEMKNLNSRLRKVADDIHFEFYGTTKFDSTIFSRKWDDYHQGVVEHFRYRQKDLLVFKIDQNPNWGPICSFLDKPIPKIAFPYLNKSK